MPDALSGPVAAVSAPSVAGEVTAGARCATAGERGGALALVVGPAANRCFETGRPVRVADLLPEPAAG